MSELKAGPGRCEEASVLSREKYIPCNAPATEVVRSRRDGGDYRMCDACADHNKRNRGFVYVGPYNHLQNDALQLIRDAGDRLFQPDADVGPIRELFDTFARKHGNYIPSSTYYGPGEVPHEHDWTLWVQEAMGVRS